MATTYCETAAVLALAGSLSMLAVASADLAQYITKLLRERWRLDCHRERAGTVCYRVPQALQLCSHSQCIKNQNDHRRRPL